MASTSEKGERYEHEVADDEQHGRDGRPAGSQCGVTGEEHEGGGPAQETSAA